MSVQAMSWVIENSQQKGSSFVVLLMIANHAHSDGTQAFPSYDTLAREARITHRQVTRIIPKLVASGELILVEHGSPKRSNLYRIPISRDIMSRHPQQIGRDIRVPKCPSNRTEPNTKQPNYRRSQPRSARDRFDDEMEQRRRLEAKAKRLDQESTYRAEVQVGTGPAW